VPQRSRYAGCRSINGVSRMRHATTTAHEPGESLAMHQFAVWRVSNGSLCDQEAMPCEGVCSSLAPLAADTRSECVSLKPSLCPGRLHLLSLVCRTRTLQDCSDSVLAGPRHAALLCRTNPRFWQGTEPAHLPGVLLPTPGETAPPSAIVSRIVARRAANCPPPRWISCPNSERWVSAMLMPPMAMSLIL
jgi:hypothetical protein